MTLELDLTEVEAWEGGEILPPGTHDVEVTDAKEGTSSGGHPQVELDLRAIGGENVGGTIRDWIVITPSTMGKVKQVLGVLGFNVEGKVSLEASELVNRRARIVVRVEQYDGKDRSRVMAYEPLEGGTEPPAQTNGKKDDDDLPF